MMPIKSHATNSSILIGVLLFGLHSTVFSNSPLAIFPSTSLSTDENHSITTAAMTIAAAVDASSDKLPAMWKMSDSDTAVTLFGTLHLLPPGVDWQSPLYISEMQSATTTITEADADSPEALSSITSIVEELGFNPPGTLLSDILGKERAERLFSMARPYGIDADQLESMRPWLASLTISISAIVAAGYDPTLGVDKAVTKRAKNESDELVYLETARYQIEALASLDTDESIASFDSSLTLFEQIEEKTEAMLAAWESGDLAGLELHVLKDLRDLSGSAYRKLIVERNQNWVEELSRLMTENHGHYFVAVGAGHLVGEDSVIQQLLEMGYRVERIQ